MLFVTGDSKVRFGSMWPGNIAQFRDARPLVVPEVIRGPMVVALTGTLHLGECADRGSAGAGGRLCVGTDMYTSAGLRTRVGLLHRVVSAVGAVTVTVVT